MSLEIVPAPTTSTTTKSSSSSGQGLSTTGAVILLGILALLLVSIIVVAWFASRDWRRKRSFRQQRAEGSAVSLAARTAFARGDYMAVINIAEKAVSPAVQLLLAQSYARIGADGLAANTASEAIKTILTDLDPATAEPIKGFSTLEMRALQSWLDRLDGAVQGPDEDRLTILRGKVLGQAPETREESVQLNRELDNIRQRVAAERTAEQASTSKYRRVNLIAGTLAGGLAAASGVVGVLQGTWIAIAALAFSSAAITAVLTTLKPAEQEKESRVRADALGQLAAAIDLFDIDRPDDAASLFLAVKEAHERLAVAEGHGKILPLVASSKSTAGTAIT